MNSSGCDARRERSVVRQLTNKNAVTKRTMLLKIFIFMRLQNVAGHTSGPVVVEV